MQGEGDADVSGYLGAPDLVEGDGVEDEEEGRLVGVDADHWGENNTCNNQTPYTVLLFVQSHLANMIIWKFVVPSTRTRLP